MFTLFTDFKQWWFMKDKFIMRLVQISNKTLKIFGNGNESMIRGFNWREQEGRGKRKKLVFAISGTESGERKNKS